MEQSIHAFHNLFEQLGLPNDDVSIRRFIETHSPWLKTSIWRMRRSGRQPRRLSCARKSSKMPTGPRSWIASMPRYDGATTEA